MERTKTLGFCLTWRDDKTQDSISNYFSPLPQKKHLNNFFILFKINASLFFVIVVVRPNSIKELFIILRVVDANFET